MIENHIRSIRENRGLSLDALAKRVGTSNQQISHLELGRRRLTANWLLRLAEELNCDPMELLGIPREPVLSEEERSLLSLFGQLPADQRAAFLSVVRTVIQLATAAPGSTEKPHLHEIV